MALTRTREVDEVSLTAWIESWFAIDEITFMANTGA